MEEATPTTLQDLCERFTQACDENNLLGALLYIAKIKALLEFDLLSPESVAEVSDETVNHAFTLTYALAKLNDRLKQKDEALRFFNIALIWLRKTKREGDAVWRARMMVHEKISVIYFEKLDLKCFMAEADHVIAAYQKITPEAVTSDDIYVLIDTYHYSGNHKQADHYRGALINVFWRELDRAEKNCRASAEQGNWERVVVESEKAKEFFKQLCRTGAQVHDKGALMESKEIKLSEFILYGQMIPRTFATILEYPFNYYCKLGDVEKAQAILEKMDAWLKMLINFSKEDDRKLTEWNKKLTTLKVQLVRHLKVVPPKVQVVSVKAKPKKNQNRQHEKERKKLAMEKKLQEEAERAAKEKRQKEFEAEKVIFERLCCKFNAELLEKYQALGQKMWRNICKTEKKLSNATEGAERTVALEAVLLAYKNMMNACDNAIAFYESVVGKEYSVETLDDLMATNESFRAGERVLKNGHNHVGELFVQLDPLWKDIAEAVAQLRKVQPGLIPAKRDRKIKGPINVRQRFISSGKFKIVWLKPVELLGGSLGSFLNPSPIDNPETLLNRCENLIVDLMRFQAIDSQIACRVTAMELCEVCEQLYSHCPALRQIAHDQSHKLCEFMRFLQVSSLLPFENMFSDERAVKAVCSELREEINQLMLLPQSMRNVYCL